MKRIGGYQPVGPDDTSRPPNGDISVIRGYGAALAAPEFQVSESLGKRRLLPKLSEIGGNPDAQQSSGGSFSVWAAPLIALSVTLAVAAVSIGLIVFAPPSPTIDQQIGDDVPPSCQKIYEPRQSLKRGRYWDLVELRCP